MFSLRIERANKLMLVSIIYNKQQIGDKISFYGHENIAGILELVRCMTGITYKKVKDDGISAYFEPM